ncbi:MAG: Fic family protein [Clostridiales bacterium]|nr:Fic family protein [Clostridiales bacterium]
MKSKYNMTIEENVFFAKRNIVDMLYKSARLEGIAVTYPETDAIYNGINIDRLGVKEIVKINNLKYAWAFLLDNLAYPFDYPYLCKLNQLIGNGDIQRAGFIRNLDVSIGGTDWKPERPDETRIKDTLSAIGEIENPTERAIKTMLYCVRGQFFLDGNKRTSMLAANQILISHGAGVLSVPIREQPDFLTLLVGFYETGEPESITRFLYDKCIDGMATH